MNKDYERRKQFLLRLTRKAGQFVVSNFFKAHRSKIKSKSQYEIVTPVDLKTEAKIIQEIQSKFSNDSILSEESGFTKTDS